MNKKDIKKAESYINLVQNVRNEFDKKFASLKTKSGTAERLNENFKLMLDFNKQLNEIHWHTGFQINPGEMIDVVQILANEIVDIKKKLYGEEADRKN